MKSIVNAHNLKLLPNNQSFSKKAWYAHSVENACFKGVYKASIITNGNDSKEHISSTGASFKTKYNQHMHSFKPNNSTQTTLSKYFKTIDNKDNMKIEWTILHKTTKGVPLSTESCSICNLEK